MTEKDVKGKEMQSEEIDPRLKELIEIMKLIKKEMPDTEKEERITVFLEYTREKKGYVGSKQNTNNTSVDIDSLIKSLTFKTSKNGKSEFASIDRELGEKLPQSFERGEYNYFNKRDALIRVKNNSKQ